MSSQLPNFLLVGAAKSGTTALANTLERHPEVYFCPIKEPKFLSTGVAPSPMNGPGDDLVESIAVRDLESYRALFEGVNGVPAIGEGSVDLLFFAGGVNPRIRELLGDPKILIVLRDPVERAFSAYKQLIRDGRERLSFEEAIQAEDDRRSRNWEFMWYYTAVGRYADQVSSFLDAFSRVHVALYDDLRADPDAVLDGVLRFLEIAPDPSLRIKTGHNPSAIPRNPLVRKLFAVGPAKLSLYRLLLRLGISETFVLGCVDRLRSRHSAELRMAPETRQLLREQFREDVERLQEILDRDLSAWLS
jgi:hypothetical protein